MGTTVVIVGIMLATVRLIALANLPSVLVKCEYLMARLKGLAYVAVSTAFAIMIMALSIAAVLVRSSAVAFLGGCGMALLTIGTTFHIIAYGDNGLLHAMFIDEARRILDQVRSSSTDVERAAGHHEPMVRPEEA